MRPPSPPLRAELVRRLLNADRLIGSGNLARATELLSTPRVEELLAGRVLRHALAGSRHAAAQEHAKAIEAFEAVAACPLPLPGAMAAAARYLLERNRLDAGLACLGRSQLLAGPLPAALKGLRPQGESLPPELFRQLLEATAGRSLTAQMRYKRLLIERHGASDAAFAYAMLLGGATAEIIKLPLQALRDYAARHAASYIETDPRQPQNLPSPRLVGQPPGPRVQANGRTLFVTRLDRAVVAWRSSVIQTEDAILYDWQDGEFAALPADLSCDAQCFQADAHKASLIRAAPPNMALDEAISLLGAGSFAFGHWVTEFLCKFLLIDQQGQAPGAPVLIDQGMPESHRQALIWLSGGRRRIVEVPPWASVKVERLWTAATICYMPFYPAANPSAGPGDAASIAAAAGNADQWMCAHTGPLARIMADIRRPPAKPAPVGRVFLARSAGLHRKLVNQRDAARVCEEQGFVTVYPETLSFEQQLALIGNATHIVGPAGSAMLFAIMFARPGTELLFLNSTVLEDIPAQTTIAEARSLRMQVLQGLLVRQDSQFVGFSDYEIPLNALRSVLECWALPMVQA